MYLLTPIVAEEAEKAEQSRHGKKIDPYMAAHEQAAHQQTVEQEEQEEGKYARPGVQDTVPQDGGTRFYGHEYGDESGIPPHYPPYDGIDEPRV